MNESAPDRKKARQPIAYTVGAPVAIVLFVSLLIGSVIVVRSMTPTGSERREREQVVTTLLRDRMPEVFPPDNSQLAGVTLYAEAGMDVVAIRVHGVLDRELQARIIQMLREARAAGDVPSSVLEFYYPEARPPGFQSGPTGSRIPIHSESPQAFRVEPL